MTLPDPLTDHPPLDPAERAERAERADSTERADSAERPARLAIDRVQLVSADLAVYATVSLGRGGSSVTGVADGAATSTGVQRCVATATVRAVEQVTAGHVRFEVEHVELVRTGPDRTALVVVSMVTERSTQRLSGVSVVREDARQAFVRAVLDAVNRRVEPWLEGA